jgi:serine-type D-Ala-D-Ala carboxypeptidase/endopeptidase (penicillin-binding protein 4)
MRALLATVAAAGVLLGSAPAAASTGSTKRTAAAEGALRRSLVKGVQTDQGASGAYVLDLTSGQPLFSSSAEVGRLPASVEKLYTTSTALLRFGPSAKLSTTVFGVGTLGTRGTWQGTLFLRGGGDPTFGSAGFDQANYGTGATIQRLAANLRAAGVTSIQGRIVGDESYFDALRGTPATGFQFSPYVEGSLSALAFNAGLTGAGAGYIVHPALYAAQQLAGAMRGAGIKVPNRTPIGTGVTPTGAAELATVRSPTIAKLIQLTNTPSNNFFAEMLLKGLGARFGGAGTTAAGAAVVRAEVTNSFGIHPQLDDGSGLSRTDSTSPLQVVKLLKAMSSNTYFVNSLAVAGETGTLQYEMQGSYAQGRCHGKTGTLHDVASLVGYCDARDGHTLAFAFLMNGLSDPSYGHAVEDTMAIAVAKYNG